MYTKDNGEGIYVKLHDLVCFGHWIDLFLAALYLSNISIIILINSYTWMKVCYAASCSCFGRSADSWRAGRMV